MALFVKILRSRRFYTQKQHGSLFLALPTLDFAVTGSGGIVIGGTGFTGGATPAGAFKDGGVRILPSRQGVRVW